MCDIGSHVHCNFLAKFKVSTPEEIISKMQLVMVSEGTIIWGQSDCINNCKGLFAMAALRCVAQHRSVHAGHLAPAAETFEVSPNPLRLLSLASLCLPWRGNRIRYDGMCPLEFRHVYHSFGYSFIHC